MTLNSKAETILWCNVYAVKIVTTTPAKAAAASDNAVNELRQRITTDWALLTGTRAHPVTTD